MNCDQIREQLLDWDNVNPLAAEVEAHLKTCKQCREEAYEIREAANLLLDLPEVNPCPQFSAAWRNRVREEAMKTEKVPQPFLKTVAFMIAGFRPVMAVGMAFLVLTVGLTVYFKAGYQPQSNNQATIAATGSYQIKIIQMGPRSKQVQKVIRNFRSTHGGGIVYSLKDKNEDWAVFEKLNPDDARELLKALENAGAKVEVKRE